MTLPKETNKAPICCRCSVTLLCLNCDLMDGSTPGFPVLHYLPEFAQIRWPKDWSFSFSISLSNENSGLISFRIDWFDLLGVKGTLKCLFQHESINFSADHPLHGPTLTSVHDYLKNYSFDYMDLCWERDISAF